MKVQYCTNKCVLHSPTDKTSPHSHIHKDRSVNVIAYCEINERKSLRTDRFRGANPHFYSRKFRVQFSTAGPDVLTEILCRCAQ